MQADLVRRRQAMMADYLAQIDQRVAMQGVPGTWGAMLVDRDTARHAAASEIARLQGALVQAHDRQIWLENTLSWRMTAPLRMGRDGVRVARRQVAAVWAAMASSMAGK
ncbi:hypothetical protein [Ketogulonicigenium robustum]|uniref:hypothetical protein n=1 Tax=Ketogulonicigenium robustum TaxID=92947 RepID=UPI000A26C591|nr:hypothetical protein [Ketogulonicigenium robustum]